MTEQSQTKALNIVALVCLVCFLIAAIASVVFFIWWGNKDRIEFGSEKFNQIGWMTASSNKTNTCQRGDMAFDLQQHILFPGFPKDKVMLMLGRPTWDDGSQIEYDLGTCMHVIHGIRLFFNEQDQLIQSRIVQH